jgi:hypothetical protein
MFLDNVQKLLDLTAQFAKIGAEIIRLISRLMRDIRAVSRQEAAVWLPPLDYRLNDLKEKRCFYVP